MTERRRISMNSTSIRATDGLEPSVPIPLYHNDDCYEEIKTTSTTTKPINNRRLQFRCAIWTDRYGPLSLTSRGFVDNLDGGEGEIFNDDDDAAAVESAMPYVESLSILRDSLGSDGSSNDDCSSSGNSSDDNNENVQHSRRHVRQRHRHPLHFIPLFQSSSSSFMKKTNEKKSNCKKKYRGRKGNRQRQQDGHDDNNYENDSDDDVNEYLDRPAQDLLYDFEQLCQSGETNSNKSQTENMTRALIERLEDASSSVLPSLSSSNNIGSLETFLCRSDAIVSELLSALDRMRRGGGKGRVINRRNSNSKNDRPIPSAFFTSLTEQLKKVEDIFNNNNKVTEYNMEGTMMMNVTIDINDDLTLLTFILVERNDNSQSEMQIEHNNEEKECENYDKDREEKYILKALIDPYRFPSISPIWTHDLPVEFEPEWRIGTTTTTPKSIPINNNTTMNGLSSSIFEYAHLLKKN